MSAPQVFHFQTYKRSPVVFMARMRLPSGAIAEKNSYDAIKAAVYEGASDTPTINPDLIPAVVMRDELVGGPDDPDPRWTPEYDEPSGYNFLWECPGTAFPNKGHYRVEIIFSKTGNVLGIAVYEGAAISTNA